LKQEAIGSFVDQLLSPEFPLLSKGLPFQSEFMRRILRQSMVGVGRDAAMGNCGIVSDLTYSFFHDRRVKLMSSHVYNSILDRWVPVIMTVIFGETEEHYRLHFVELLKSMVGGGGHRIFAEENDDDVEERRPDDIGPCDDWKWQYAFAQVVDFSKAQLQGFVQAYVEVVGPMKPMVSD